MGIYNFKLESGAVEDAINSGTNIDDIGADLDAIQQSVEDSHDEEVEAAQDGTIGDEVEESAMIMYESQYNYNQLLEAMGMYELREASYGREAIYEAVDIKGFFNKVKEILKKMFEKISEVVKTVLSKLDFALKIDKKYVAEHKTAIQKGFDMEWEAKGYTFKNKEGTSINISKYIKGIQSTVERVVEEGKANIKKIAAGTAENYNADTYEDEIREKYSKEALIKMASHKEYKDVKDYTKYIRNLFYGSEQPVELKGTIKSADEIISVLSGNRETTDIRQAYSDLKQYYKKAIRDVDTVAKEVTASEGPNFSHAMREAEAVTSYIKTSKELANHVYTTGMKAARAKRAQARKLAHAFVAKSKQKKSDKGNSNIGPQNASASLFNSFELM